MPHPPTRDAGRLHRSAIATADKLATPATPTLADVTTGGSLAFNTAYKVAAAAANAFGPTVPSSVATLTTANDAAGTHAVRVTLAQVTNAVYYDLFLSTDAAPLYVARITEAQRAAGCTVTAVGTVTATSPGAGKVDIRVVGTGVATTANPFANSTAYDLTGITPVDCTGATQALIHFRLSVTDLRSLPTFAFVAVVGQQNLAGEGMVVSTNNFAPLSAARASQEMFVSLQLFGAPALYVLVDSLTGQGAAVDIYVDLV